MSPVPLKTLFVACPLDSCIGLPSVSKPALTSQNPDHTQKLPSSADERGNNLLVSNSAAGRSLTLLVYLTLHLKSALQPFLAHPTVTKSLPVEVLQPHFGIKWKSTSVQWLALASRLHSCIIEELDWNSRCKYETKLISFTFIILMICTFVENILRDEVCRTWLCHFVNSYITAVYYGFSS